MDQTIITKNHNERTNIDNLHRTNNVIDSDIDKLFKNVIFIDHSLTSDNTSIKSCDRCSEIGTMGNNEIESLIKEVDNSKYIINSSMAFYHNIKMKYDQIDEETKKTENEIVLLKKEVSSLDEEIKILQSNIMQIISSLEKKIEKISEEIKDS